MFYTRSSFSAIGGMMMLRFGRRKKIKIKNDRDRNLADDRNMVIKKVIKDTSVVVDVYVNQV